VSETQGYKKPKEFTFPANCYAFVRALVAGRVSELEAVLDDPEAEKFFNEDEFMSLSWERLMLAKMLVGMPEGGPNA
jgi:hypothetical protein